jgi:NitT/TauT family transport system permease protein
MKMTGGAIVLENSERQLYRIQLRKIIIYSLVVLCLGIITFGIFKIAVLLSSVSLHEWFTILFHLALTFIRVMTSIAIGTVVMVPLGVTIGMNPKLSRILQPIVQVVASFPAPMLFPLVILGLSTFGIGMNFGAVALMLLGTQWYILFNVIAGAMAIPQDLREAATVSRLSRRQTWSRLILPAIFPSLVTGWVTSAGGAWNASIVAEYVHFGHKVLIATGLGSTITTATDQGNFALLTASVLAMAGTVVLFNKFVWRTLYKKAEERFSLNK